MKKLNLKNGKKLELRKTAIASLSNKDMSALFGGATKPTEASDPKICQPSLVDNDGCGSRPRTSV